MPSALTGGEDHRSPWGNLIVAFPEGAGVSVAGVMAAIRAARNEPDVALRIKMAEAETNRLNPRKSGLGCKEHVNSTWRACCKIPLPFQTGVRYKLPHAGPCVTVHHSLKSSIGCDQMPERGLDQYGDLKGRATMAAIRYLDVRRPDPTTITPTALGDELVIDDKLFIDVIQGLIDEGLIAVEYFLIGSSPEPMARHSVLTRKGTEWAAVRRSR